MESSSTFLEGDVKISQAVDPVLHDLRYAAHLVRQRRDAERVRFAQNDAESLGKKPVSVAKRSWYSPNTSATGFHTKSPTRKPASLRSVEAVIAAGTTVVGVASAGSPASWPHAASGTSRLNSHQV